MSQALHRMQAREARYGVIEAMKMIQHEINRGLKLSEAIEAAHEKASERYSPAIGATEMIDRTVLNKPMVADSARGCPSGHASGVVRLPDGQLKCSSCGRQWYPPGKRSTGAYSGPSRREVLGGMPGWSRSF